MTAVVQIDVRPEIADALGKGRPGKGIVNHQDIQYPGNDRVDPSQIPALVVVALEPVQLVLRRGSFEIAEQ